MDRFLPFYPLTTQKIKILKKAPGDIIILHMCSINDNHVIMVPQTWSTTDRIFCHFGLFFVLLPPNNSKNQNFTEIKKAPGDIIIFHMCSINDNHVIMFPQTWSTTDRIFCHFGPFFVLLPPNNQKNQNFAKMKKRPADYHFTHVSHKW